MKRSVVSLAASVMKTAALIALVLAIAVPAFADGEEFASIAGKWVMEDDTTVVLRIDGDGSGTLTVPDPDDGIKTSILVRMADGGRYVCTVSLADGSDMDFMLCLDAGNGELVMSDDEDHQDRFIRDTDEGIPDLWIEVPDMDAFAEKTGFRLAIPEEADDVELHVTDTGDGNVLGEMRFSRNGMPYTARAAVSGITDGIEDISGLYYEWEYEEETTIGGLYGIPAIIRQTADGSDTVEVVIWQDADSGIVYSLSTVQPDVDGLDLTVIADRIYIPAKTSEN